jgi:hypothetical protein
VRQVHQIIRLEDFSRFTELPEDRIYFGRFLDVYNSHDLYFNRIIRQIAPIRMTGKFGSEIVKPKCFQTGEF